MVGSADSAKYDRLLGAYPSHLKDMLFATNLLLEISRKQQINCQSIPISHTSLGRRNASSQESQSLREFGFGMETIEQWQKRAKVAAAQIDEH